ncbi:MAG: RDD family protein [Legionella sp.]|uniref:RDD family protein n=1 Tax=Legionella sp. TaxID=459 RepID=UPI00283AE403|nr:RDD family protein [Legionella sp.]
MDDVAVTQQFMVHPWRRFLARCFDQFLMKSVIVSGIAIFFPSLLSEYMNLPVNKILNIALAGLLTSLLTPFSISLFGATPGKYIFGIQIRDKNFKKLPILTSLKREFLVCTKGMAFGLPIVNLFAYIINYSRLKKRGITSWDKALICNVLYRENNLKQKILYAIGMVTCTFIFVTILLPAKTNDNGSALQNKMYTAMQQLLNENKDRFNSFYAERDALGSKLEEVRPSKLRTLSELKQARKTIRLYRDYLYRHRIFLNKFNTDKTNKLTEIKITSTVFWNKYKIAKEQLEKNIAMYFETENRFLDVASMMINLIESNQGHLAIENDGFLFENTDAVETVNYSV